MSVKCQQIINWIENLAPKKLAESWDNVGLQLGSPSADISKVMVSLDLNEKVAEEAVSKQVDLIITHHPYIFKPLSNLRTDLPYGKVIEKLIQAGIGLYVAHTNLDIAKGGVNFALAKTLGLTNWEILKVTSTEKLFKITVFVPKGHEDKVRQALAKGGAGWIGSYSECTFQLEGTGTFKPEDGTNPFIGTQGKTEFVDEYRVETIVPEASLRRAVNAMIKAHPYEEVAYDVYPLANEGEKHGLGIMGKASENLQLSAYAETVKSVLGVNRVKSVGAKDKAINKVAVCGGSGGDLIGAAHYKGADLLITGDVGYHQAQQAESLGLAVIDAGHFATEQVVIPVLAAFLKEQVVASKKDLELIESQTNIDIWEFL